MTWVRLDDKITEHPKVVAVGPLGLALYVAALTYCARNLTDGFIPTLMIPRLIDCSDIDDDPVAKTWQIVGKLVDTGLWEAGETGGYWVHDYLDFNPSKEDVNQVTAARKEAGGRGGLAKAKQNPSKPSSKTEAKSYPVARSPEPVPGSPEPEAQTTDSSPEVEESVDDGAQKHGYPDWFQPLVALKGFKHIPHKGSIKIFREGCEEAGVEIATVVSGFAEYYAQEGGRASNGWSDPVKALARTLPIQIRKVRDRSPQNGRRPGKATQAPELAESEPISCAVCDSRGWYEVEGSPVLCDHSGRRKVAVLIGPSLDCDEVWGKMLNGLEAAIPKPTFETWVKNTKLLGLDGTVGLVAAPTPFAAAWLERRMYNAFIKELKAASGHDLDIVFVVEKGTEDEHC